MTNPTQAAETLSSTKHKIDTVAEQKAETSYLTLEQTLLVRSLFHEVFLYRYELCQYLVQSREAALARSLRDRLQPASLLHEITRANSYFVGR